MASVHTQPGRPFFFCAYTDHEGRRRFISTKTSDRKEAEKVARGIEATVEKARTNRITPDNARAVIEGVVEDVLASVGAKLERHTTGDFLHLWLKGKPESTRARYSTMISSLLGFLGPKANRPISVVASADIEAFKNDLTTRLASSTVSLTLKVLRSAFKKATQLQLIDKNPASFVEGPRGVKRVQKEDFTKEQIDQLLSVADEDWTTMIHLGTFTGQRLKDLANLRLANLDFDSLNGTGVIRLEQGKTGRVVEIPMAAPLKSELLKFRDSKADHLLPKLAKKRSGWLSNQFYQVMHKAGLVPKRDHRKHKQGRNARRVVCPYGFHSFRHSATSFLKNAGVPEAVARDIIGHESAAISRRYTHIDLEAKRKAVNKMAKHVTMPVQRRKSESKDA